MKTIHIRASREYDVCIGAGLLGECGERIAAAVPGAEKAVVYTDTTVYPLYARRVTDSLKNAGFTVLEDYFLAGEGSKTLRSWERILCFLAEHRVTRSDVVVALGGGVVGDMVGFAAACYQRGVRFVQIPTTLLAAVDSSVGGKTAVDLPMGKNLAGAFWQPSLVLCDTDTLQTLPPPVWRGGCAEIIKYGVLDGEALFSRLEKSLPDEVSEEILARCVEIKRDIVAGDEFDTGARRLLNLGHTAAHAAELLSDYSLSHGEAVAMGLVSMARSCAVRGLCPPQDAERIENLIKKCGLPAELPYPAQTLGEAALADKKRAGSSLSLVTIEGLGRCAVKKIDAAEYPEWLRQGGAR